MTTPGFPVHSKSGRKKSARASLKVKNRSAFASICGFLLETRTLAELVGALDKRCQTHFLSRMRRVIDLNNANRLAAALAAGYLLLCGIIQRVLHQRARV